MSSNDSQNCPDFTTVTGALKLVERARKLGALQGMRCSTGIALHTIRPHEIKKFLSHGGANDKLSELLLKEMWAQLDALETLRQMAAAHCNNLAMYADLIACGKTPIEMAIATKKK